MSLPFQCLSPLGQGTLFCAARGCSIQTFDLGAASQSLFSWTHPSLKQADNAAQAKEISEGRGEGEQPGEEQPPSKRRKLGSDAANSDVEAEAKEGEGKGKGEKKKRKKKGKAGWAAPRQEAPFVVLLTATEDGSHVVAVTGQDKTLWVFRHDGKGLLEELSQRAMPKRPCSLALTADGQTILSADKFGDVYALPLVPRPEEATVTTAAASSSTPAAPAPAPASASASASASPAPQHAPRGANVFTVHSQRNRRALEDQQKQREANAARDLPKGGPAFAHEVLLGHVSMLTCVLAARDPATGRPYIITADRDEHVRVSRGVPQAHVVEAYCLGHASFVSALCCCAPRRPDVLVSGGGDDTLLVWDWRAGGRLGAGDLLGPVRDVLPGAAKVAVTKLIAYEAGDGDECHVLAICERVPALFIFQLAAGGPDDGHGLALTHRATLRLRGNPLDVAVATTTTTTTTPGGAGPGALLVGIDAADGEGGEDEIAVFGRDPQALWTPRDPVRAAPAGSMDGGRQPALSRADLDKALYTVESLRKTGGDEPGEGEGEGEGEGDGE
ncbi:hypothetical protein F4802DRAFT_500937 [Xylaria palmicola]|nr:hypothetical protein F4802DRAFT_500937 [Xylaria palmicola]